MPTSKPQKLQVWYVRPKNQKAPYCFPKKPKPKPRKKKALFDITGFNRLCRKSKDAKIRAMVESIKKYREKHPGDFF